MSAEFDKLKNKVASATAIITHQNTLIGEKDAQIAKLQADLDAAKAAPVATPEVTDADYASLNSLLDAAITPALATNTNQPSITPPAEPTILPQAGVAHPALQG